MPEGSGTLLDNSAVVFRPEACQRPSSARGPTKRARASEPSREVLEMMRHVDVTRDGFEVMHHRETTREQRSLEHVRTVTRHFMFVEPGTVRACFGFAFDRQRDAVWAAHSIAVMLDILDDWESQGGARDEPPDPNAVIAPTGATLYSEQAFAGVEATVPLRDFGHLKDVVDSAVDNAASVRTEDELRIGNRERVWRLFQPRAGTDFE